MLMIQATASAVTVVMTTRKTRMTSWTLNCVYKRHFRLYAILLMKSPSLTSPQTKWRSNFSNRMWMH